MKVKIHHILMLILGLFSVSCEKILGGSDSLGGKHKDKNDNKPDEELVCAYGVPNATYVVKGRVTDEAGNPIEGIKVVPVNDGYWKGDLYVDPAFTDADGKYETSFNEFPEGGNNDYKIRFEDVDGEENGGLFRTEVVDPEFSLEEEGDGDWYDGRFSAEVNLTLSLEKDE